MKEKPNSEKLAYDVLFPYLDPSFQTKLVRYFFLNCLQNEVVWGKNKFQAKTQGRRIGLSIDLSPEKVGHGIEVLGICEAAKPP